MKPDRYTYRLLDACTLTEAQFAQMVEIECNCGLEPYTPEMLMTCITDMETFACFDGECVVGFLTVNCRGSYYRGSAYIVNLNVSEPYRGQNVAKRLMYEVCRYCRGTSGISLITLDVQKTNRAFALYQKLGFLVTAAPSRNGDTDVVMAAPLPDLEARIRRLLENEG